jgi:Putative MetA-pathway of phenol degradation
MPPNQHATISPDRGCRPVASLLVLFGGLSLILFPVRAQTTLGSDIVIVTDRPSVTNSSLVVPQGGFQAENGLLVTNSSGDYVLDIPETNLRYGLLQKTEIRFLVPDYFQNLSSGTKGASGFGDLALGVKQQIGPLYGFDLSAIVFVSFPTGANRISSHGYDPGLQFPWSHKLSENWTAAGQVAFYWPTQSQRRNFTGETTFLADRQLTGPWDAFVEYAGDFPQRGGARQFLHFGTAYKLTPRQQLDFHVAVGLSEVASRGYIGFGYSFLIAPRK